MPAETETRCNSWLAYILFGVLSVPVVYVIGFGPVVRIARVWPEASEIPLFIYSPIFELPTDSRVQAAFYWYGKKWLQEGEEGIVVPIYSGNPDYRARELIYTSDPIRNVPEIQEGQQMGDEPAGSDGEQIRQAGHEENGKTDDADESESRTKEPEEPTKRGIEMRSRELIYESENLERHPDIWERIWFLDSPNERVAQGQDKSSSKRMEK